MSINKRSRVIGISVVLISVIFYLADHTVIGQQQNCIDAANTKHTTVITPAVVKLGGTTVVQCQVSPPGRNFCGFRITLSGPSVQFAFDKTYCPRGTISESRYTGQCDVTVGRYGIRIESVQMTDAGRWRCNYMSSYPNSRTVLTVIVPPSGPVLTSQPNTAINNIVTVQENSPLTITCDGSQSGATGLTYKWSGVNLPGQSNNRLSFTRISKTDSGVYTCKASNTAGTVTGSITINVLYAPTVSAQVESVAAKLGETAKFTINYDANPSDGITLSCVKNETNGKTSSFRLTDVAGKTQLSATIRSVQASDYGTHSCQLKNSIGSAFIALQVKEADATTTGCGLSTRGLLGGIAASLVVIIVLVVAVVILFLKIRKNNSKSSVATKTNIRSKSKATTRDEAEMSTRKQRSSVKTNEPIYGNREMNNVARNTSAFRDVGEEYEEI
ncbi:uncharacterized protein LOC141902495 isoform X2 [Tubulanus polymorphus]|uniref:uncharacterized protein LOC141902495 isoform X2 n=1 Tax=Tubulanus polymorphus TaxID=672921 RepID=UPI003DA3AEEF